MSGFHENRSPYRREKGGDVYSPPAQNSLFPPRYTTVPSAFRRLVTSTTRSLQRLGSPQAERRNTTLPFLPQNMVASPHFNREMTPPSTADFADQPRRLTQNQSLQRIISLLALQGGAPIQSPRPVLRTSGHRENDDPIVMELQRQVGQLLEESSRRQLSPPAYGS